MRWAISEVSWVKPLLRGRWLQWGATLVTLAVFVVVILTGLFGTPAGNHNFGIVYVWLVWWALLKLGFVPSCSGSASGAARRFHGPCSA